jgi:hypothetical protein
MDKKKVKIRIRDEHPGSYFRQLRNNFWVKNSVIRDPESSDPGSGMEKFGSGIWDNHPRSATLQAHPCLVEK